RVQTLQFVPRLTVLVERLVPVIDGLGNRLESRFGGLIVCWGIPAERAQERRVGLIGVQLLLGGTVLDQRLAGVPVASPSSLRVLSRNRPQFPRRNAVPRRNAAPRRLVFVV